jgi:hypothetical protein
MHRYPNSNLDWSFRPNNFDLIKDLGGPKGGCDRVRLTISLWVLLWVSLRVWPQFKTRVKF